MGRPTKGEDRLISITAALTKDEIRAVMNSAEVGSMSQKIRALVKKALGE